MPLRQVDLAQFLQQLSAPVFPCGLEAHPPYAVSPEREHVHLHAVVVAVDLSASQVLHRLPHVPFHLHLRRARSCRGGRGRGGKGR